MPCVCGEHSCFCFNVCRCRKETCVCEDCTEIRLHSCTMCQRPAFLEGRFKSFPYFKEYCSCFIGESQIMPSQPAAEAPQQFAYEDHQDLKVDGWPPLVIAGYEDPEHTEQELTTVLKDCKVSGSEREASQKTESYLSLGVSHFQETLSQKAANGQDLDENLNKPETRKVQRKEPSEEDPSGTKGSVKLPSEKDSSNATGSMPLPSDLLSDKISSESSKLDKLSN